jgi:CRP/FNR family cyclic AMP-dependent transcriptional regulator
MTARLFDLLDVCTAEARQAFAEEANIRAYDAGEIIYWWGDGGASMFRIVDGSVRLAVGRADGRELYCVMLGAGDCFGISNYVDGLGRPQTAEARTAAHLQIVSARSLDRLIAEFPCFSKAVMKLLANHMRYLIDLVADSSLNDLPERVARRILGAIEDGREDGPIELSQSEIAHMVGASRQSVNKVLQQFQQEHLISISYGGLTVIALNKLRKQAMS